MILWYYVLLKKTIYIQVLLASAFIPIFSGFVPPYVGEYRYMDGGFTDNLPILDTNTITVSPFSGLSDICPRDNPIQKYLVCTIIFLYWITSHNNGFLLLELNQNLLKV